MQLSTFNQIISENKAALEALTGKKTFVIGSLTAGTLLTDTAASNVNAELFSDEAAEAMSALLKSDFLKNYPTAVLVDFSKAVSLYLGSDQPEAERIETSFMMARVNFMGTDGIRGKVVLETEEDFISLLLKDNAFTPELVSTTSFSFATMLKNEGIHAEGDTVVMNPRTHFSREINELEVRLLGDEEDARPRVAPPEPAAGGGAKGKSGAKGKGGAKGKSAGARKNAGGGGMPDPKAMFDGLDKNKDGAITKDENELRGNFAKYDKDGDGRITPEELKQAFANR